MSTFLFIKTKPFSEVGSTLILCHTCMIPTSVLDMFATWYLVHVVFSGLQPRKAQAMDADVPKRSGSSSSSLGSPTPPVLVMDSLPLGTDDGETQPVQSAELEMLAEQFHKMTPKTTFVPEAPTATCIYHTVQKRFNFILVGKAVKAKTHQNTNCGNCIPTALPKTIKL